MKRILMFAVLAMIILCAASCGSDRGEVTLANLEDFSEYRLVRGEYCSDEVKALVPLLNNAIKEKLGATLKVSTDISSAQKEILIGETKRGQSKDSTKGLGYNDFVIKQIGAKIIIAGGSDKATADAVEYFISNYISDAEGCLKIPEGKGYSYIIGYKLSSFTVNKVDIKNFKIKDLYGSGVAEKLSEDFFTTYLGYRLEIEEGEMVSGEHYIVLDNGLFDYDEYSIEVKDGNLHIIGSYASFDSAVEEFYSLLDNSSKKQKLSGSFRKTGKIETPQIPYKSKEDLLKIVEYLYEDDRIVFGQHLAGACDLNRYLNEYTEAVGEGPGILDVEMNQFRNATAAQFSQILCQTIEYAAKGGLIASMHHWVNPADPEVGPSGQYGGVGYDNWEKVMTKGTKLNRVWHEDLDIAGLFFSELKESGVSVMFRPMIEANGADWFWWCADANKKQILFFEGEGISSEDMARLWIYVHDYYTKDLGLDNLLWTYAPNVENGDSLLPITYYYPGDEYCDIVGLDWYTDGNFEIDGSDKNWDTMMEYGKPVSLTEFGLGGKLKPENDSQPPKEGWNCANYVEIFERMVSEGMKLAFVEVYGYTFGAPAYAGNGGALAECDLIISLDEMPEFIKEVLG